MPATEVQDLLHIVRHLVEYQSDQSALTNPALQFWIRARGELCGDMLFVGRAPNGALNILLVDAGSAGVTSYLSAVPIIAPFRRMTEKGFAPATIARELNLKTRHALPANRSIAALLATVDSREGVVSVWNGGMPAAFILDGFGRHVKQFPLCHAALGVRDDATFDDTVEQHAFSRGEQLVMVSDGLLSAASPAGTTFGLRGLFDTLTGLPRSQRRAELIATVEAHLDGRVPADDIALVLVDCEKAAALKAAPQTSQARMHQAGNWSFMLQLDANELRHLDVVPLLLGVTSQFPLTRERSGELFVILSELFNNALDHGVLRLDSELKLSPDGMESWLRLREEKLSGLYEGVISLHIEQLVGMDPYRLRIVCRDSGSGFDLPALMRRSQERLDNAGSSALPFGRGLALMKNVAKDIEIMGNGSEVTVLLPLEVMH